MGKHKKKIDISQEECEPISSDYFLNNAKAVCGIRHTYHPIYFEQIKYFADSQGWFRYGHPVDSEAFENQDTIQLLINPIWWVAKGSDALSKLHNFLDFRIYFYYQKSYK